MSTVINGINTELLGNLAGLLSQNPDAGRVTFHSRSLWQQGTRVLTRFAGYTIDGDRQHEGDRQFVLLSDEPVELSGTDAAPSPIEQLLHALGACIAATTNANAALMGIELTQLEVRLESDLNLRGFFALDDRVRPGIGELRAQIAIAGNADAEKLREIVERGYRYSPIRESVNNGVTLNREIIVVD
jgi:uncharacterized OsmC-like protein